MTDLIALARESGATINKAWDADEVRSVLFPVSSLAAFAARIAKAPEDAVVPLAWSDPTPPADSCPYDHCKATTPFGPILITWKGWKDHPSFFADTFPCADGYLSLAAGNVEDAKQEAEAAYRALVRASLPPAHQAGGEGWQDIASAPKDGTDVLGMYMHIETQIVHNIFWIEQDDFDDSPSGWWSYTDSEVSRTLLDGWCTPTHWMALPKGPSRE